MCVCVCVCVCVCERVREREREREKERMCVCGGVQLKNKNLVRENRWDCAEWEKEGELRV